MCGMGSSLETNVVCRPTGWCGSGRRKDEQRPFPSKRFSTSFRRVDSVNADAQGGEEERDKGDLCC
eukprot:12892332-Prorocentrum_lima.AAC.1